MVRNPYANTPAGVLRKLNEKWRENPLDPTFGYTEKFPDGTFSIANWMHGARCTCPEAGQAESITAYIKQSSTYTPHIKCALYKDVPGYIYPLIGYTEEWLLTSGWDAWKTFNIISGGTLENADYWLMTWGDATFIYYFRNINSYMRFYTGAYTYDAWPDTIVGTRTSGHNSIYCTYTPAPVWGGSALPQLQMAKAILGL